MYNDVKTKELKLFVEVTNKVTKEYNSSFYNTPMNIIYTAIDESVQISNEFELI